MAGDGHFNHNRDKQLFSATCLLSSEDTSSLAVFSSDDLRVWDYATCVRVCVCKCVHMQVEHFCLCLCADEYVIGCPLCI